MRSAILIGYDWKQNRNCQRPPGIATARQKSVATRSLTALGASGAGGISEEPPGTEESTIKISRSATVTVAFIDMAKVTTNLGTSGKRQIWQIWQIANDGDRFQRLTQHHTVIITHPVTRESWR